MSNKQCTVCGDTDGYPCSLEGCSFGPISKPASSREVRRHRCLIGEHPNSGWAEMVRASYLDTALSQLAALREELTTAKRNEHNSEVAYKAAIEKQEELREELAESDSVVEKVSTLLAGVAVAVRGPELALHRHSYHDLPERVSALQQRLTAAEHDLEFFKQGKNEQFDRAEAADQRNADVESRAADLIECLWGLELPGAGNPRLRKLKRALEALKPTESGASE